MSASVLFVVSGLAGLCMLILLGLALCRAAALGDAFHVTIDDEDGEESW